MSENRAPPAPAGHQQQHSSSTTPTNTGSAGASQSNNGSSVPMTQLPGNPSFRRQRASRACETCHARKVRCDAASLGVCLPPPPSFLLELFIDLFKIPCTNCTAFGIECKITTPKRKKTSNKKDTDSERGDSSHADLTEQSPQARQDGFPARDVVMPRELPQRDFPPDSLGINTQQGLPDTDYTETYASQQRVNHGTYAQYMKPKFARAPIKEAGRVAYLGESSNLSLLVQDRH
ncbi:hypothetical protein KC335_g18443, partial [Hortaea werneckii]